MRTRRHTAAPPLPRSAEPTNLWQPSETSRLPRTPMDHGDVFRPPPRRREPEADSLRLAQERRLKGKPKTILINILRPIPETIRYSHTTPPPTISSLTGPSRPVSAVSASCGGPNLSCGHSGNLSDPIRSICDYAWPRPAGLYTLSVRGRLFEGLLASPAPTPSTDDKAVAGPPTCALIQRSQADLPGSGPGALVSLGSAKR